MPARTRKEPASLQAPVVRIDDPFRLAFWANPDDVGALRVWADSLSEQGDPRGEFIQLSVLDGPSAAQQARHASLARSQKGKLVGPARPFLRTWSLGEQGLVTSVTCEASKFIEGFDEIVGLHPRLTAHVTAVRKEDTFARFARLELHRLAFVTLEWSALTDAGLIAIAPALKGLKNLSLAYNLVSGAGLRAIAPFVKELEYLALGTALKQRDDGAAIGNGWADALCDTGAYKNLRAVHMFNYTADPSPDRVTRLWSLPRMKSVTFGHGHYYLSEVEALKRG